MREQLDEAGVGAQHLLEFENVGKPANVERDLLLPRLREEKTEKAFGSELHPFLDVERARHGHDVFEGHPFNVEALDEVDVGESRLRAHVQLGYPIGRFDPDQPSRTRIFDEGLNDLNSRSNADLCIFEQTPPSFYLQSAVEAEGQNVLQRVYAQLGEDV